VCAPGAVCTEPQRGCLTPSLAEHDPVDPPREDSTADHGATDPTNAFAERAPESTIADSTASSTPEPSRPDRPHEAPETSAGDAGALTDADGSPLEGDETRRTIKRYSNRKLYDTRQSRYVTLLQIAEMVRAGEDVQIIDNATKEDKTDVTLALIISEELKARPRAIPLATLKALIRHRGGKLLTQLRESPIGRLMPRDEAGGVEHDPVAGPELSEGAVGNPANSEEANVSKEQPGGLRRTLEQWQHTIDDRIRAVVPHFSTIQELQGEVQQLSKRLEELEKRLASPRE
jgi:polyhydroxyalkanoate synthesis repressor PhaR